MASKGKNSNRKESSAQTEKKTQGDASFQKPKRKINQTKKKIPTVICLLKSLKHFSRSLVRFVFMLESEQVDAREATTTTTENALLDFFTTNKMPVRSLF